MAIVDFVEFYSEEVALSKYEKAYVSKRIYKVIRKLFKEIYSLDCRFGPEVIKVGSGWNGLKTKQPDEFDVNIPLNDLRIDCTVDDDERLEHLYRKNRVLPSNCCFVKIDLEESDPNWEGCTRMGYLIPSYVRREFKGLLEAAIDNMSRDCDISLRGSFHGPALTIGIRGIADYDVSVDVAPVITAGMPLQNEMTWPREKTHNWLSRSKIQEIENLGCDLVPVSNPYWRYSYSAAEYALFRGIDADGGCRKCVLRIIKRVNELFWSPGDRPLLSSFVLKNCMLRAYENRPYVEDWQWDDIDDIIDRVLVLLLSFLGSGKLPLYFSGKLVNLLGNISQEKHQQMVEMVRDFKNYPGRYIID